MDIRKTKLHYALNITFFLVSFVISSSLFLASSTVSADNDTVIDDVSVEVPISCTLSGTGMTSHTDTVNPGTYKGDIGITTLKAICNDSNGFAIYAAGYTGESIGETNSNKLVGANTSQTISTGTATSGSTSNWAMKLATNASATYPIIIAGSNADTTRQTGDPDFSAYAAVPNEYTKVAYRTSATDIGSSAVGSTLTTTYAAFVSSTQSSDTYAGKVIYTLIHPHSAPAPVPVSKNLYYAITGSADNYTLTISDSDITSGAVASGPVAIDGYTFDEEEGTPNTPWYSYANQIKNVVVSGVVAPTSTSAWFAFLEYVESWDLSGLKTDNVTNMFWMFAYAGYNATTFTPNLSSWNTTSVTNMSSMFYFAGYYATTWSVGDLSNWNTSSVTDMSSMFSWTGTNISTAWSVGDLSSWDTSKVTNMSEMFSYAGQSVSTFSLDLSSWNTSSVTNMSFMFFGAGQSATTWSVGDLSSWDTSKVTDMSGLFKQTGHYAAIWSVGDLHSWNTSSVTNMSDMFSSAGYSASTWSIGNLSNWNTSSVTDMSGMFYFAGYSATTWSVGNLSNWNTSSVTRMYNMFCSAGYSATTFNLNLSSWNTSSVTTMSGMFSFAGYSATTWSIGNLSNWNTSSVTDMSGMFYFAGYSATTWSVGDLSNWNTSNVTIIGDMFHSAGYSATTFNLDLSNWDTSNVNRNMSQMFNSAGFSATTWSVTIPKTNNGTTTGAITNTTSRLYGKTKSYYAIPPSGRSFTLAN